MGFLCPVYILYHPLQENQRLREQNEELNGQILSMSLHEAKNLIATQTKAQSLAAEIENASRDQVRRCLVVDEEYETEAGVGFGSVGSSFL